MKKLLNTLYVTSEDAYLSLDGENVVILSGEETRGRFPLHTLEGIVTFGYTGASPALMGKCAEMNKPLVFMRTNGRFLARVVGKQYGNVLLRMAQHACFNEKTDAFHIAKNIISAKLTNSAAVLRRAVSDHEIRLDATAISEKAAFLKNNSLRAYKAVDFASLRGLEGESANQYFSVFDQLILQQKDDFQYNGRSRRPPMDPVNAMLSFGYSLLTSMCTNALEAVGLDPYIGIFHTERPGRCSLSLDLAEEFRAAFVDRFILSLINMKMVSYKSFSKENDGAVLLTDDARKDFLTAWQRKKQEELIHPYLGEKAAWGLMPHIQAMLLARFLRGDIDDYPPFIWK